MATIIESVKRDKRFGYMLLDRMQQDCDYYLNQVRSPRALWAEDEQKQIDTMREIYAALPVAPCWLTLEQIDEYAKKMNVQ